MPRRITPIRKLLVANRGEIAIRIFRACTELGIRTVAVYSQEDKLSLHRYKADEGYLVGEGQGPVGAYLAGDEIIALARRIGVEAIHPGYGFLAEHAGFAEACGKAGVRFIGPPPRLLRMLGEKTAARAAAVKAGLPVLPGSPGPVSTVSAAARFAREAGFPVLLKAAHGGGGRGIRLVSGEAELRGQFAAACREAQAAFGRPEVFVEKFLRDARHLEVQILADADGHVVHLLERDCSLQRRYQKIVEIAPAFSVPAAERERLQGLAVRLARSVRYANAGTVEFLRDGSGRLYFIEVNPRIQVEHTVTEMVTGVDLVQAQIRLAEGRCLWDRETGVPPPEEIRPYGIAVQCRITTENPAKEFMPDYGRLTAYRSASGFGIRLDAGSAFAGAVITPFYDSLLVKVTAWGRLFEETARRMRRALAEFRVRGVATNIPFLMNVFSHPVFLKGGCTTRFIDAHPELFRFSPRRDRGTRLLEFLGDVVVNGNPLVRGRSVRLSDVPVPPPPRSETRPEGTRDLFKRAGPDGVTRWLLRQKRLFLTDTTMRDAHQSLLATRMRTQDMLLGAAAYPEHAGGMFSLEVWGGATFDTALRFMKEDPWERLARLRERIPNILFQMLLRGANAVGYTHYPDNVVRAFVRESAEAGVDVFRIFDALNWVPGMTVAMEAARKAGAIVEAAICYTGDLSDPARTRYGLRYYLGLARELKRRGTHLLCLKDMAGLLRPPAARSLVKALREETGLPIHLHTHDTPGGQSASLLAAAEAGVDVVDAAIAALSGTTSQPSLNAVVAMVAHTPRDTGLDLSRLNRLSDYWEGVRRDYAAFEGGQLSPAGDVYEHEMPGGQYTNLREQAASLGLAARWGEVKAAYAAANRLLGDLVKVTPSSKVVGDLALFMVANRLSERDLVSRGATLNFPESVVGYLRGELGRPPFGYPRALQKVVLRGQRPFRGRPGARLKAVNLVAARKELSSRLGRAASRQDLLSSLLYPKVFQEFEQFRAAYGDVSVVPTRNFLYGMASGEEIAVEIEPGKRLIIKFLSVGDPDQEGNRMIHFELNGMPRDVVVRDRAVAGTKPKRAQADPADPHHLAAMLPGVVVRVLVTPGKAVLAGEPLLVIEAMKMQVTVTAPRAGGIQEVLVDKGSRVETGDLLLRFV